MTQTSSRVPRLFEAQWPALIVGIAALVVGGIMCFFDPFHALRGYLIGFLFCLAITFGSMSVLMLHHLTGGAWGWLVRRPAEAALATVPLLAILFIPLAIGARALFPWANPSAIASSAILRHRDPFFHPSATIIRAAIYFVIWIFWTWRLRVLSLRHDETLNIDVSKTAARYSAVGLVMYFATMFLAGFDWIASREVDWYSSTFGLQLVIGQAVAGVAFLIIMLALLRDSPDVDRAVSNANRPHDLGNLLLTCVILWAYVSFAQLLVIWMSDMQDDITWFYHRTHRGWNVIAWLLILLHFGLPFVMLLFQKQKRHLGLLAQIAAVVLFMRLVHVEWMVVPSTLHDLPRVIHWLDLVVPFGVIGIWFSLFLAVLKRRPLIPVEMERAITVAPYAAEPG
jgi:hypothetical protein